MSDEIKNDSPPAEPKPKVTKKAKRAKVGLVAVHKFNLDDYLPDMKLGTQKKGAKFSVYEDEYENVTDPRLRKLKVLARKV